MREESQLASQDVEAVAGPVDPRGALVDRVLASSTFEKSPKLRAFLKYVCRCALDNEPAAATEQQIGIYVFGRQPGYNPNEDNIVRSQARLLRLKLEHHFAHEGKDEPVTINIPKGRYLPSFDRRPETSTAPPQGPGPAPRTNWTSARVLGLLVTMVVALVLTVVWLARVSFRSTVSSAISSANSKLVQPSVAAPQTPGNPTAVLPAVSEIRITAGNMGQARVDKHGRRWEPDRYYEGGVARPGPQNLFPPVPDADMLGTIREGSWTESLSAQSTFRYDIPVTPGVYELKLYFADPIRGTAKESNEDAQNVRHFNINVNGRPLLSSFDAIADAGPGAIAIRAFKDIMPAQDGDVHIEFAPAPERPFISAIELVPGIQGKMRPVRISGHMSDFVESDGTPWSGDQYYIGGRSMAYASSEAGPRVAPLYTVERFGNFSYAVPVPPGSYTVKLHFMESFFTTSPANKLCQGIGCRVFDVTCNGVKLLENFDIFAAAGGAFRPVVRVFHNLHPNGQGKLFLSFSPTVNYAEVRAIEVLDEAP